jgi:hypothetical protein
MKIKEVLDELSVTGNTIAKIAKDKAGIGEKRLKSALHNAGYRYKNQAPKGWYYVREGEEPLYKSVFDFIEPKTSSHASAFDVKESSHASAFDVKESSHASAFDVNRTRTKGENLVHTDFTPEEVTILRKLIRGYVLDEQQDSHRDDLYQRVVALKTSKKVRKTIVINEEVGALLDRFADHQKFNKSDLMEIAILDLIKKYSE